MRTKRSNRNLIALWVALGAVACGESGGGPASDAAAAGGTTPDASPNTDAASGGAATADATSAPEVDVGAAPEADASLPPDAGPQASAEWWRDSFCPCVFRSGALAKGIRTGGWRSRGRRLGFLSAAAFFI